tara:strand:- start:40 stop:330 length:291 start_codon:yes stop_codon:yes gene_type:complete
MDANVSEGVQNHPKASHNSSSCRRIDASRGALKVSEVLDVLDDPERIATRLLRDNLNDKGDEEEEEKEEEEEMEEETTRRPKFAGMTTRFCVFLRA